MKTLDEALAFMNSWQGAFDGRDKARFADFVPFERCSEAGLLPNGDQTAESWGEVTEWTEENILAQLKSDAEFGLEKALGERGLSANAMFETVNMWCHLLENDLAEETYEDYGREFFQKVLDHYGWSAASDS